MLYCAGGRRADDRIGAGADPWQRCAGRRRGGLRAGRGNGLLLPAARRRGAAGPAGRPRALSLGAQDDGDPAALPLGQPARIAAFRVGRARGQPRSRRPAAVLRRGRPADARAARGRGRLERGSARVVGGRRRADGELRLRRPAGADRGLPVPPHGRDRGDARGAEADDRDDGAPERRRRRPDQLRLPPLPAPARRRALGLGGRDPGPGAAPARRADAAERQARGGRYRDGATPVADLRRRLHGATRLRPLLPRRRRPPDRAAPRRRLRVLPGLRPRR